MKLKIKNQSNNHQANSSIYNPSQITRIPQPQPCCENPGYLKIPGKKTFNQIIHLTSQQMAWWANSYANFLSINFIRNNKVHTPAEDQHTTEL